MALVDELTQLSDLHARGGLTDDEFKRAKERLLHSDSTRVVDSLPYSVNKFRRSRSDRWFGGICGGVARATGIDAWVWRLLFAVLFIFAGAGLLVYLLLWIIVPSE